MQINKAFVTEKLTPVQPIPIPDITSPPFALNHARILYNNKLVNSSISSTNGLNNIATIKANTFERWTFTGNAQITFTLTSVESIDTIGIGSHSLIGSTISVYYDTNDSGMLRHLRTVTASEANTMFHFDETYQAKRISVKVTTAATSYVAYISAGIALQMQRPFFAGHTPITDSDQSTIEFNRTQNGSIISNSLVNIGYQTSVDIKNLNDSWFNQYIPAFRRSAKTKPFFFAWNLLEYPNDVGFCMMDGDMEDQYSGTLNLHNITFKLLGA